MTPALARDMIGTFVASKQSVAAFARQHGIATNRVTYWRHRLAEIDRAAKKTSDTKSRPSFAPLLAMPDPPIPAASVPTMQTLEAMRPSGTRIVIHGTWDSLSMKNWLAAIEDKA